MVAHFTCNVRLNLHKEGRALKMQSCGGNRYANWPDYGSHFIMHTYIKHQIICHIYIYNLYVNYTSRKLLKFSKLLIS